MTYSPFITFEWNGKHMVPLPRYADQCRREYKAGERYVLEPHEADAHKARGFYMACIKRVWDNLPEESVKRFPNPIYLRKWALVKCGYATHEYIRFDVNLPDEEVYKIATLCRAHDSFAVIRPERDQETGLPMIIVSRAKHQSIKRHENDETRMSKEELKKSRDDVLDYLADAIGVKRADLEQSGRGA